MMYRCLNDVDIISTIILINRLSLVIVQVMVRVRLFFRFFEFANTFCGEIKIFITSY